jgi:hypothetical protein
MCASTLIVREQPIIEKIFNVARRLRSPKIAYKLAELFEEIMMRADQTIICQSSRGDSSRFFPKIAPIRSDFSPP